VLVELVRDVVFRLTPVSPSDVDDMVRSLKTFPLLDGYRRGPLYDVAALEEILLRVGALAEDIPEIVEMDLNPVMVLERGQGAVVADARIRVGRAQTPLPLGSKKR
jgi:acetyltransferase